jgi:hypothetical protein
MRALRRIALTLPLLLCAPACDLFEPEPNPLLLDQLEIAEERWEANGAASYSYVLARPCNCAAQLPDVRVTVTNHAVTSVVYVDTEEPLPAGELSQYRTLPAYFDVVRDAIRRRVPQFHAAYDEDRGFIEQLLINYDVTTSTDDISLVISDFTVTP